MDGILVRSDNTSTAFHINHCKSQGNAFARCAEQGCRYAVPPKASSGRVETKPSCGSDDLGEVWQSRSRPVCFRIVDILSTVVLPLITNHSIGAGCTDSSLARPSPVCLPSTSTTNAQTSQNRQMPPHSTAAGSILAGKDIYVWFYICISCDPSASQRGALASPTERDSSVTVARVHLASPPGSPAVSA